MCKDYRNLMSTSCVHEDTVLLLVSWQAPHSFCAPPSAACTTYTKLDPDYAHQGVGQQAQHVIEGDNGKVACIAHSLMIPHIMRQVDRVRGGVCVGGGALHDVPHLPNGTLGGLNLHTLSAQPACVLFSLAGMPRQGQACPMMHGCSGQSRRRPISAQERLFDQTARQAIVP